MKNLLMEIRLAATVKLLRFLVTLCPKEETTDCQIILAGVIEMINTLIDPARRADFERRVRVHNRASSRPIGKRK